jgi:hypothetical protein
MNRFAISSSPRWIFSILSGILVVIGIYLVINRCGMRNTRMDGFTDTPDSPTSDELEAANTHYAGLLLFLQKYPSRAIPFIKDVKDKIYDTNCTVKSSIDFQSLAKFPNGMVFV